MTSSTACRISLFLVLGTVACGEGGTEGAELSECIDGLDNDNDGAIDCLDADCMGYAVCWGDTGIGEVDTEDSWVRDVAAIDGAEVIINEFMASNQAAVLDENSPPADPSFPDWIELYNPGSTDVDLGGYTITDDLATPAKHLLAVGLTVPAGGYLLLWADDDEEDEGDDHLSFKLAREGEEIGLYSPDGETLSAIEYGPQVTDYSAARESDGAMTWIFDPTPTADAANTL
jgi:hypothetical protein